MTPSRVSEEEKSPGVSEEEEEEEQPTGVEEEEPPPTSPLSHTMKPPAYVREEERCSGD
jgi:hypothetical protein